MKLRQSITAIASITAQDRHQHTDHARPTDKADINRSDGEQRKQDVNPSCRVDKLTNALPERDGSLPFARSKCRPCLRQARHSPGGAHRRAGLRHGGF